MRRILILITSEDKITVPLVKQSENKPVRKLGVGPWKVVAEKESGLNHTSSGPNFRVSHKNRRSHTPKFGGVGFPFAGRIDKLNMKTVQSFASPLKCN